MFVWKPGTKVVPPSVEYVTARAGQAAVVSAEAPPAGLPQHAPVVEPPLTPQRLLPVVGQPVVPGGTDAFPCAALDFASTESHVPEELW